MLFFFFAVSQHLTVNKRLRPINYLWKNLTYERIVDWKSSGAGREVYTPWICLVNIKCSQTTEFIIPKDEKFVLKLYVVK